MSSSSPDQQHHVNSESDRPLVASLPHWAQQLVQQEGMFPPGSQRKRMLEGRPYHAGRDPELLAARARAHELTLQLESIAVHKSQERKHLLRQLFKRIDEESPPWIEHGFKTDYGRNTEFGSDVYFNHNCTILDCGPVHIGSRVLFAPNVQLLGATHPLHYEVRNGTQGPEYGQPITIKDDVWIGASAIILGGVTIGKGAVVGAGAVVTRDVDDLCVVAGNPARLIRRLSDHPSPEELAAHLVTD